MLTRNVKRETQAGERGHGRPTKGCQPHSSVTTGSQDAKVVQPGRDTLHTRIRGYGRIRTTEVLDGDGVIFRG